MVRTLMFLYAESPVHAGADASVGALDLPMQRDRHTGLPVIWGQSLKGAIRAHARTRWQPNDDFLAAFGAEPPGSTDPATAEDSPAGRADQRGLDLPPGTLSIGDAELVAFPAPTLVATFAWLTSGLSLARLGRKAALVGVDYPDQGADGRDQDVAQVSTDRWVGPQVALGPYLVTGRRLDTIGVWAQWLAQSAIPGHGKPAADDHHRFFRDKFGDDLVAVGDDVLARVSVECAEVTPRIQLTVGRKTVQHGPFHTEYLPTESLLATVVEGSRAHIDKLHALLHGQILRVGGDETIGKGLMWCSFLGPVDAS